MMESESLAARKYYTEFVPTKSAQAIHKAVSTLYCCEDLVIKGKLGNGYFASVFLVHHRPTNQLMAMKLTNEASVQRREIELLSSLNHANVLRLYGSCVIGARFVCLTEYANGGSLAGLLAAKSIDLPWIVRIGLALDILNGLNHLHCHDLIHRDLTSPNILIRVSTCHSPTISNGGSTTVPLTRSRKCGTSTCDFAPDRASPVEFGDNLASVDQSTQSQPCSCLVDLVMRPNTDLGLDIMDQDGLNLANILHSSHWADLTKRPGIPASCLQSVPTIEPPWKQATRSMDSLKTHQSDRFFTYTAVVADLGLCLDLNQQHADLVSIVGNPYYTSPECLNRVAPYSFAADVFSFGLLVCELITRLPNDGLLIPRTMTFGLDHQNLPVPPDCPVSLFQVALDCCTVDHSVRPTVAQLIDRLTEQQASDSSTSSTGSGRYRDPALHLCSLPVNPDSPMSVGSLGTAES